MTDKYPPAYKFFSVTYDLARQNRFAKAVQEGDLEEAINALTTLSPASDIIEKVERMNVVYEGLLVIEESICILSDNKQELDRYRKIGDIDQLEKAQTLLSKL